ncbi:MAG: cytochrome b/b6 domain-containing protein [Rhodobacteraceae bacterium]|nr:cytochrome b/b6 domain-containing protein [Paracoccaceae bacterium]
MGQDDAPPQVRHRLADRLYHWSMAASVIALGATAFLPMVGLRFDWVPIHWIAGVVLVAAVLFHLWRVFGVHGLRAMNPGPDDAREVLRRAAGRPLDGLAPAKYDALQKGMHLAAALAVLAASGTGLVMLAKIDTTFWRRNPAILADQTWGVIYVVHGAAAMALLFLVLVHVYFALIPGHRAYLRAMLTGRGPELARKAQE